MLKLPLRPLDSQAGIFVSVTILDLMIPAAVVRYFAALAVGWILPYKPRAAMSAFGRRRQRLVKIVAEAAFHIDFVVIVFHLRGRSRFDPPQFPGNRLWCEIGESCGIFMKKERSLSQRPLRPLRRCHAPFKLHCKGRINYREMGCWEKGSE